MNCQYWPEISFCLNEIEDEKFLLSKNVMNLDTITNTRENINRQLEQLKVSLEQSLDKNFASLVLFSIVAFVDEEMHRQVLETKQGNWIPLQKDFYGAYNAGELFYETIDKIIDDPQVPSIVPMVFYFILKKGFQGKYRDSKAHINKYIEILKDKIPTESPEKSQKTNPYANLNTKKKIKWWHYYVGALGFSFALLVALYISSSM